MLTSTPHRHDMKLAALHLVINDAIGGGEVERRATGSLAIDVQRMTDLGLGSNGGNVTAMPMRMLNSVEDEYAKKGDVLKRCREVLMDVRKQDRPSGAVTDHQQALQMLLL